MFPTIKTWASAGIFAGISLIAPMSAIAKTQTPEHYAITSATEKYDASAVQLSYVGLAGGLYSNALGAALALSKTIDALNDAPNAQTLAATRSAWTVARTAYLATEAFRFYGGPIDGAKTELRAAGPEIAISTNFRLVEQLADKGASSAGQRKTLASAATALHNDVAFVLKEWDPIRRTGYAQEFLQLEGSEAMGRILRGLGTQAAVLAKDTRGDEASAILTGMHSIWHAQLNNITAPSIEALLVKIDANAAAAVSSALATAQTQANAKDPALPATLQKLAEAIANAGTHLGVAISIN